MDNLFFIAHFRIRLLLFFILHLELDFWICTTRRHLHRYCSPGWVGQTSASLFWFLTHDLMYESVSVHSWQSEGSVGLCTLSSLLERRYGESDFWILPRYLFIDFVALQPLTCNPAEVSTEEHRCAQALVSSKSLNASRTPKNDAQKHGTLRLKPIKYGQEDNGPRVEYGRSVLPYREE